MTPRRRAADEHRCAHAAASSLSTTGETCCPACTAVDANSFESHFEFEDPAWTPAGLEGCVCLVLTANNYKLRASDDNGLIELTDQNDCVRITGDSNDVMARRPCAKHARVPRRRRDARVPRRPARRRDARVPRRPATQRERPATVRDASRRA